MANKEAEKVSLGLATYGYDAIKGNPFHKSGDPGFLGKIFRHHCVKEETGESGYWDFVDIFPQVTCQTELSTKTITTYKGYLEQRSKSSGSTVGASFEASASGFGVSASASAKYSESQSQSEKAMRKSFSSGTTEVVMATANCYTHDIAFNTHFRRPFFTQGFISALEHLNETLSQDETVQLAVYKDFLLSYGTHYLKKTNFGASLIFQKTFHSRSKTSEEASSRRKSFKQSAEACVGGGGGFGGVSASAKACISGEESGASSDTSQSESGSASASEDIQTISIGSRPQGNLDTWSSSE